MISSMNAKMTKYMNMIRGITARKLGWKASFGVTHLMVKGEKGKWQVGRMLTDSEIEKWYRTYDSVIASRTMVKVGSVTGRLQDDRPNLQNIPIRTEMGTALKKAFDK